MMLSPANQKRESKGNTQQGGIKQVDELPHHAETTNMIPALFVEIYRVHFSASYDMGQESTCYWLMNENIHDFTMPSFTKEKPPCPCMVMHEGCHPKMLLWMLEEYLYILGHLREDDCDGHVVLGHELLLLVQSCCYKKRGGSRHCHASRQAADNLPISSSETLECLTWALKDSVSLECLSWAIYDNILVPVPVP